MKTSIILLGCIGLGIGCGKDSKSESVSPSPQSLSAATEADLPTCDSSRESQLVYITESQELRTCTAGTWVAVAAPKVEMTGSYSCKASPDLHTDDAIEVTGLAAFITTYSNDMAHINCVDTWVSAQINDTTTGNRLYTGNTAQMKAGTLYCVAVYTRFLFNIAAKTGEWRLGDSTGDVASVTCDTETF